jgi:hypothetical protein
MSGILKLMGGRLDICCIKYHFKSTLFMHSMAPLEAWSHGLDCIGTTWSRCGKGICPVVFSFADSLIIIETIADKTRTPPTMILAWCPRPHGISANRPTSGLCGASKWLTQAAWEERINYGGGGVLNFHSFRYSFQVLTQATETTTFPSGSPFRAWP